MASFPAYALPHMRIPAIRRPVAQDVGVLVERLVRVQRPSTGRRTWMRLHAGLSGSRPTGRGARIATARCLPNRTGAAGIGCSGHSGVRVLWELGDTCRMAIRVSRRAIAQVDGE